MRWTELKGAIQTISQDLVEAIFPPAALCPLCQAPAQDWLCVDCEKYISHYQQKEFCRKCGKLIRGYPHPRAEDEGLCLDCAKGEVYAFWFNRGVAPYLGMSKEALYQLKYTGRQKLAQAMGLLMTEVILNDIRYRQVDVVVPVPIGPNKLQTRGFNQAELLAGQIARGLGLPMRTVLNKPIDTLVQAKQDKYTRQQQVKGAYRVTESEPLEGLRVLLVDDVFTTGSTASECARVLRASGVDMVAVVTWATGSDDE